jgi:hydrophobin
MCYFLGVPIQVIPIIPIGNGGSCTAQAVCCQNNYYVSSNENALLYSYSWK